MSSRNELMRIISLATFYLLSGFAPVVADVLYEYDPSLATFPNDQGWSLIEGMGPPPPTIIDGALHQFEGPSDPPPMGGGGGSSQYWQQSSVHLDFVFGHYVLEAELAIISSEYDPDIDPAVENFGQRSGYYLWVQDNATRIFAVGIDSEGIAINTDVNFHPDNGLPRIAVDTSGVRNYRLEINNAEASLTIDDILFGTLDIGEPIEVGENRVIFGDVAGPASESELHSFRFSQVMEPLSPGDFDQDGDVDGADFLKWQRGEISIPPSAQDLVDWMANYGAVPPVASTSNVPEPRTTWIGAVAIFISLSLRLRICPGRLPSGMHQQELSSL